MEPSVAIIIITGLLILGNKQKVVEIGTKHLNYMLTSMSTKEAK